MEPNFSLKILVEKHGLPPLTEPEVDSILAQYARMNYTRVACPYITDEYPADKHSKHSCYVVGIKSISYGSNLYAAKLNALQGFLQYEYFALDENLQIINPLLFDVTAYGHPRVDPATVFPQ